MLIKVSVIFCLIICLLLYLMLRLVRKNRIQRDMIQMFHNEKRTVISFLHSVSESLVSAAEIDKSFEMITKLIVSSTDAEIGAIFLIDKMENILIPRVVFGSTLQLEDKTDFTVAKAEFLIKKFKENKIKMGEGVIGLVAQKGEAKLIKTPFSIFFLMHTDANAPKDPTDILLIDSFMAAPFRIKNEILGVVVVLNKKNNKKFSDEDMNLLQALSDQAALTVNIIKMYDDIAEKQRMKEELKVAQTFQKLLLPKECPKIPRYEISAYNNPALEVGGDYYDFIWIDEEHLAIVIADVSGKGIPASMIMAMARSILRAECMNTLSPKRVLLKLNDRISQDISENVFITMTYAILDLKDSLIKFCRAGHEPLLSFNKKYDKVRPYTPPGVALGLDKKNLKLFDILEERIVFIDQGDIIIFYTDGITESMSGNENEYGEKRFHKLLIEHSDSSAGEIINTIVNDVQNFSKGYPQHDDITLIAIKKTID